MEDFFQKFPAWYIGLAGILYEGINQLEAVCTIPQRNSVSDPICVSKITESFWFFTRNLWSKNQVELLSKLLHFGCCNGLVCPGNTWTSRLSQITVCSKGEGFQVVTWKLKIEGPRSWNLLKWYGRKKESDNTYMDVLIHTYPAPTFCTIKLWFKKKKLIDQIPKDWKRKAWDWKAKILRESTKENVGLNPPNFFRWISWQPYQPQC